jgi:hypothetical protein
MIPIFSLILSALLCYMCERAAFSNEELLYLYKTQKRFLYIDIFLVFIGFLIFWFAIEGVCNPNFLKIYFQTK